MRFPNLRQSLLAVIYFGLASCSKESAEKIYFDSHSTEPNSSYQNILDEDLAKENYTTENVIVLVIDGPRFSETWGDPYHENIPVLSKQLSKEGVVNTAFYNLGPTYTSAGHTAITTGHYQKISNSGTALPEYSSIFQHWLKKVNGDSTLSYVIASKDKLAVLADTKSKDWKGKYRPATDCGINGLFSGYRADEITYQNSFDILAKKHPRLVLINLKDPDFYGHKNLWDDYLEGIRKSDKFMGDLWAFIERDPFYAGKTTLIMTNDHGRHTDGVLNGFVQHGDDCNGCRHINFFAVGPDFKKDIVLSNPRNQVDISVTVAELLGFEMPHSEGSIMWELFEHSPLNF